MTGRNSVRLSARFMGVDNVHEIRKDSQGREIKSNRAWREECERLRLAVDLLTIELEATRAERDAAINKGINE